MAGRSCVQSLSRRLCRGTRSLGAVPEASGSTSSSQRLINLEYEYSAHKYSHGFHGHAKSLGFYLKHRKASPSMNMWI